MSTELPGHALIYSGKVRELYAPLDPETGAPERDRILLVASDRISAYDFILDTPIPDKGAVLTQLSLWWFEQLADLVPNHVVGTEVPDQVRGRAIYVRRLEMLPVECIARAYLTGGGLAEYRAGGSVSGVALPDGLEDASRLPEPVFTPTTKAPVGEHDQPISYEQVVELVGRPLADQLRELTVQILARGNELAAERGILIADTKVEFGLDPDAVPRRSGVTGGSEAEHPEGVDPAAVSPSDIDWHAVDPDQLRVVLADEVLTPDSSRFWRAEDWAPGRAQTSYDKQVLRDWLTSPASGWDRSGDTPPPALPEDVVALTRARYVEAYEALTQRTFEAQ